jgi:hypothetical protein
MTAQYVIDKAKVTELNQLAIKDDDVAIAHFLELGLIELHKRFDLKTSEHLIGLQTDVWTYNLPTDALVVTAAFSEAGDELTLNDETDPLSVFTPTLTTVTIPNTITGAIVSVIYRAAPDLIDPVDLTVDIGLNVYFLQALLNYIGYRAHSGPNGDERTENNTHYKRFEASCKEIVDQGLVAADNASNTKLTDRGFA